MKNVFLFPSEDKTNLVRVYSGATRKQFTLGVGIEANDTYKEYVNIYLTSDEDIKDGEYGLVESLYHERYGSHQTVFKMNDEQRNAMEAMGGQKQSTTKKIIFTNDTELIEDGVQAIDEAFLTTYGKNPIDTVIIETEVFVAKNNTADTLDRQKFYALYWGQDVFKWNKENSIGEIIAPVGEQLLQYANCGVLQLKSLSKITDEDVVQLLKATPFSDRIVKSYTINKYLGSGVDTINFIFVDDTRIGVKLDPVFFSYGVIDFFRSRGYALPFMTYSVEELVTKGWIELV